MSHGTGTRRADPQLKELVTLLSEQGVRFWLESGTLLGACREGDVIRWDTDLDFGCWVEEEPRLRRTAMSLAKRGYGTRFEQLAGEDRRPATVVIRPPLWRKYKQNKRTATIALYRRYGELAMRPSAYVSRSGRPRWSLRWLIDESLRFGMGSLWRRWLYPRTMTLPVPRVRFAAFTWSIPAHFFEETTTLHLQGLEVPVPVRWQEYLAFRYGDWRVPDPAWDYYRDDRAVVRKPFDSLLAELGHD